MSALSRPYMRVSGSDRRLRILAYHEVDSPELFHRQMSWLTSQFDPVPLHRCLDHESRARLPERPIVVTFDDGDPSIVETALPYLEEFGVKATAFICPGVVDTTDAYWWQVVDAAIDSGVDFESLIDGPAIARLKSVPDLDRLRLVDQIAKKMEATTGQKARKRQITSEQLRVWVDAGHQLGNHTWDHPILDMCTDDEQRRQIMLAHGWLVDFAGECDVFAYPNGTTSDHVPVVLTELGYRMALLFDHRISSESDPRFQVSRIRVNGHDPLEVFRAKVSGVHPFVHRFTRREGLRTDRPGRM